MILVWLASQGLAAGILEWIVRTVPQNICSISHDRHGWSKSVASLVSAIQMGHILLIVLLLLTDWKQPWKCLGTSRLIHFCLRVSSVALWVIGTWTLWMFQSASVGTWQTHAVMHTLECCVVVLHMARWMPHSISQLPVNMDRLGNARHCFSYLTIVQAPPHLSILGLIVGLLYYWCEYLETASRHWSYLHGSHRSPSDAALTLRYSVILWPKWAELWIRATQIGDDN